MPHRENDRDDDWARQIPWERGRGPYRDYGWERGQSVLPEFRDPSVRVMPYERDRVGRWRDVDWDDNMNRGSVRGFSERSYAGKGPRNYRRSDELIFEEVCERLKQHGMIDASRVNVNVKDGDVVLKGKVPNRQMKHLAERVVDRVSGIKAVNNELRVEQREGERVRGSQSGMPGGGQGRVDEVGGSGVYPASGPLPGGNAETHGMASWGQGERGAAGYQDHGESELNIKDSESHSQRDQQQDKP